MPWCRASNPPGEQPARYVYPNGALGDDTLLGRNLDYAYEQRKSATQARESLLAAQKKLGKPVAPSRWKLLWLRLIRKPYISDQKWLAEEAAYWLKVQRGWDAVIGIVEGKPGYNDWRKQKIQEEIAPFVDMAFNQLEYGAKQ